MNKFTQVSLTAVALLIGGIVQAAGLTAYNSTGHPYSITIQTSKGVPAEFTVPAGGSADSGNWGLYSFLKVAINGPDFKEEYELNGKPIDHYDVRITPEGIDITDPGRVHPKQQHSGGSVGASAKYKRLEDMSTAELQDLVRKTKRHGEVRTDDYTANDQLHDEALRILRKRFKRLEDMSIAELRDVIGETRRRGKYQAMNYTANDQRHDEALRILREKFGRQTGLNQSH